MYIYDVADINVINTWLYNDAHVWFDDCREVLNRL